MSSRSLMAGLGLAAAAVALIGVSPVGANQSGAAGSFKVVVDGLNNPRQIAIQHGLVFVAEAGKSNDSKATCVPDGPCIGSSGSVTGYVGGFHFRVQTGLPSRSSPNEGGSGPREVTGVDALAIDGTRLYGVVTGSCEIPPGLPADVVALAGKVIRLHFGNRVDVVGDASRIECQHDPDGQGPDTDPYGIAARDGTFYVADAAGNDVVKIRNGVTTVATVLSKNSQPVPTSLAFGPDGALYIGTLNFEGGPGGANVYRLAPGSHEAKVYASGLTAITGIAFGSHGQLYVSEFTTGFGPNGPTPNGDVVVIPKGGGQQGRRILGAGQLHFPGGVGVSGDKVYVSNWSIADAVDGAFGPGNHGQLVRITDAG